MSTSSFNLKSIQLKNFKGYLGESQEIEFAIPDGTPGSGLNILVGENNGGKSTLLEAIFFLYNNSQQGQIESNKKSPDDKCAVIGKFTSPELSEIVSKFTSNQKHTTSIQNKIISDEYLKVQRSSSNAKTLYFLNETEGFESKGENITGIDTALSSYFDLYSIKASDDPQQLASYGSKTFTKNLLESIFKNATETEEYQALKKAFDCFFNTSESSLKQQIREVEKNLTNELNAFFGEGSVSFQIPTPDVNSIVKNLDMTIDAAGANVPLKEHGNGLQRMVAFALLVVWANCQEKNPTKTESKPYALILDEPEICMHPRAQQMLLRALLTLSQTHQVFVSTHSPLFLHLPEIKNTNLITCKNEDGIRKAHNIKDFANLFSWSPSWSEIAWFAYQMPSVEFHNELWGEIDVFIKNLANKNEETNNKSINDKKLDTIIRKISSNLLKEKIQLENWINDKSKNTKNKTNANNDYFSICYCVRNAIHHLENCITNPKPRDIIDIHLQQSIQHLIPLLKIIKNKDHKDAILEIIKNS